MKIDGRLRVLGLGFCSSLLVSCDGGWAVTFAGPFPAQAADMAEFPARHRGVYTADDSTSSVCIGRTAVWVQELETQRHSRHEFDSLGFRLRADSTYLAGGKLHYLHQIGRDSVRDSWLRTDTIFTIGDSFGTGHLRRFQGRYYLSIYDGTAAHRVDMWDVERLEIKGRHLLRQRLGTDTLRLRALAPATVRYTRYDGTSYFQIAPGTPAETRRVGRYAGLWETTGDYERRY
ncbi:hypothetical protein MON38_04855 [Hymenobacter sp. DH14]|uniref:Lipoprotein n=1 Tax=Hymenobacter cyanobacteriorum TaxID=2926463 RepID=A0A9X1VEL0_9BACT|nr:hypothetical protein [Hymenobacter cyanobacteriorum]MCI1186737.1 hypothetical protein [Hymenobacter cyanobacteriorum]